MKDLSEKADSEKESRAYKSARPAFRIERLVKPRSASDETVRLGSDGELNFTPEDSTNGTTEGKDEKDNFSPSKN